MRDRPKAGEEPVKEEKSRNTHEKKVGGKRENNGYCMRETQEGNKTKYMMGEREKGG